jgi:hypothetical protein
VNFLPRPIRGRGKHGKKIKIIKNYYIYLHCFMCCAVATSPSRKSVTRSKTFYFKEYYQKEEKNGKIKRGLTRLEISPGPKSYFWGCARNFTMDVDPRAERWQKSEGRKPLTLNCVCIYIYIYIYI